MEYPIIREKRLNNKSRKGMYVYVKLRKGLRGAYYKKREGVELENYLTAYEAGLRVKKKGVTKEFSPKTYLKKVKQRKSIDSLYMSGVYSTHLKNALNATPLRMQQTYMNLFAKAWKDKQLRNVLTRDENIQGIKHRLGYDITLIGDKGMELAVITHVAQKTLREVVSDINQHVKMGQEIKDNYPIVADVLKKKGYSYYHKNNGKIRNVNIVLTFRKA